MLSKAYENLIDERPVILKSDLDKYREGLMYAAIGSKSEIAIKIDTNIDKVLNYYDFFGIEATGNKNINEKIVNLCRNNGKIVIGVSNCDFINKEDSECIKILNFYKNSNDIENGLDKYLHTTSELLEKFNYIENAEELVIDNTNKIAEMIDDINITAIKGHYPIIKNADKIIKEQCYDKAHSIYGQTLPNNIQERLDLEFDSIIKYGYESIYLISSDMVKKSNELGYEVGCRGGVRKFFCCISFGNNKL
jgi:DNA polymerase-3 subunit alpha (Gram-positive type)